MDNPENLEILCTQDRRRRQTKHNTENKNDEQHGHHQKKQKPGVNPGARDGEAGSASYKTFSVLLIYIVKSGKGIVGDR